MTVSFSLAFIDFRADLLLQLQFWLFASHFTGIARLLEHDNTKFGPQKLEEYVYLEEPIAFEFARFAIAVVDKEKIAAPTQVSHDLVSICHKADR